MATINVVERIQRKAGETRYCNCESDACANANAHPSGVCHKNATVIAECFGIKQQLCSDCLSFAQKRYNTEVR